MVILIVLSLHEGVRNHSLMIRMGATHRRVTEPTGQETEIGAWEDLER